MTVRVAVDAMGGDHAPAAIVRGAVQALTDQGSDQQFPGVQSSVHHDPIDLVLVGDEGQIHKELQSVDLTLSKSHIRVVHASEVIEMDESPIDALKSKKDSSLLRMTELAINGEVDAIVSAGNTGAMAAACQLKLKTLSCVSRPGIAVAVPSIHGPVVLCDAGANIQAKPKHLHEYAVMAALYAQKFLNIDNPRVALISIGEESVKGTGLIRETHQLLSDDPTIHFVGNAEGRDLFDNYCDVAICDGFVGNIVLKLVEGLSEGLFRTLVAEFEEEAPDLKTRVHRALDNVWGRHDYSRYGGAPMLGVNGVCIICHGRSNERAICNAVKAARGFVRMGFNEALVELLSNSNN